MSAVAEGSLAFSLLNDFQHGFPLCAQPFVRVAHAVGSTEDAVLATYGQLHQSGCLSRIGAVFAPRRMGASILAALSVPPEQLDAVAAVVSQFAEVNHNYEREHRFNLWFVVTAPSSERLDAVLAAIESCCALPVLRLPLEEQFHIDLGFRLNQQPGTATARATTRVHTDNYQPRRAPASGRVGARSARRGRHDHRRGAGAAMPLATGLIDAQVHDAAAPATGTSPPVCSSALVWWCATTNSATPPTPWWCITCPMPWYRNWDNKSGNTPA